FINDFEHDTNAQAVTMAVIGIGSRLGMTVVTEGVETEQQRRLLEELKCDVMQGYLFAKPLAPKDLEQWVRQRRTIKDLADPTKKPKTVSEKNKPN
ncbi:EAL domain-containing protein, partial [Novacetimonas hansenii]